MTVDIMDNLNELTEKLESIKLQQKVLNEAEALCREEIQQFMQDNGIEKEATTHGSVRLQQRANKQYNDIIVHMEQELKETKKLADDLGDYKILSYKESLVYSLPKEEQLF
jgi:gamma-glutamylcysteine synthetase